jgi:hypothetical protein
MDLARTTARISPQLSALVWLGGVNVAPSLGFGDDLNLEVRVRKVKSALTPSCWALAPAVEFDRVRLFKARCGATGFVFASHQS